MGNDNKSVVNCCCMYVNEVIMYSCSISLLQKHNTVTQYVYLCSQQIITFIVNVKLVVYVSNRLKQVNQLSNISFLLISVHLFFRR